MEYPIVKIAGVKLELKTSIPIGEPIKGWSDEDEAAYIEEASK